MIVIDRDSPISVHDQLVDQLRYLIASGRYPVGSPLPSTRELGSTLQVSFHTVRKAYSRLEQEGLVSSKVGSGYTVEERVALSKSDRMERGAGIVQDALKRLIGLGFSESEIELLLDEQFSMLDQETLHQKIIFVAPFTEKAELCSARISRALQRRVEPVAIGEAADHQDADVVLTQFDFVRKVAERIPRADVLGLTVYPREDAIEKIARMIPAETLGVVVRSEDAINPLLGELRASTGFGGNIIATTIKGSHLPLTQLLRQSDLVVYTPGARRTIAPLVEGHVAVLLQYNVGRESLEMLKEQVAG